MKAKLLVMLLTVVAAAGLGACSKQPATQCASSGDKIVDQLCEKAKADPTVENVKQYTDAARGLFEKSARLYGGTLDREDPAVPSGCQLRN